MKGCNMHWSTLALVATLLSGVESAGGKAVCLGGTSQAFKVDFNSWESGQYSKSRLWEDFNTDSSNHNYGQSKIVEGYTGSGLQITYPKSCVGSSCTLWFSVPIPDTESVTVSFRVKFEKGFTFKKGGKLPGVCGGQCNTGFKTSSGYDGFSSRVMWRANGHLVSYAYHPGQRASYGDDYPWSKTIVSGKWYRFTQYISLNKAGKSNGILAGYIDGENVYYSSSMVWRKTQKLKLTTFQFATFFGGDNWTWAPTSAQKAVFDDIVVCS